MKILYFHQHFSTPKGSAGIRSYEMARRLIHHGHKVTMVCGSYGGGETGMTQPFTKGRREAMVDGIHVIEFDLAYSNSDGFLKRTWLFISFALRSIGIVLFDKYDIVFATTTPLTAGIPGIFARWIKRKPFVFEVRDLWPELPKAMGVITNPFILHAMSFLEWASYRSANRCIGLSPGIVDGIHKRGVRREKITLVSNGCDLDIFANSFEQWRPDGVSATDLMVIYTGTHGIANGLDAVLNAAKELKERNRNDIKIVLIGQGGVKARLQERAAQEHLTNVIFHSPVNKVKLAGLMASADLGLQTLANVPAFYFGTSPNKFFDYLSAGLPVINNYPGWLAHIINENACGFAIPPDDAQIFADILEQCAQNKEALADMGKNARKLAETEFNRADLADFWVNWVVGAAHD